MDNDISNIIVIELLDSLKQGNNILAIPSILNNYENKNSLPALSFFIGFLRFIDRQEVLHYLKSDLRSQYIDAEIYRAVGCNIPRKLDLSGLRLTDIDLKVLLPRILSIEGLDTLKLSDNLLTSLPSDLAQINTLRNLYVGRNQISSVPQVIIRMHQLYLDLVGSSSIDFLLMDRLSILEPEFPERVAMVEGIKALQERKGYKDGRDPATILNGKEVIDNFLRSLSADYKDKELTMYYHMAAKHLLKQALLKDLELSNATLIALASSMGNCKNPVIDLLAKTAIGILRDSGIEIPTSLEAAIHRQAFEEFILKNRIPLLEGDTAEAMSGLTNTLFYDGAEYHPDNPLQIVGERTRIPSKTEDKNIDFAFKQITEEVKLKFAKLICKTDENGVPITNAQRKYILDPTKYMVITEAYMKDLGVLSKREHVISNTITKFKKTLPKSFSIEHYSDSNVSKLIDFSKQELNLREALAIVPDNMIDSTAKQLFDDFRSEVKSACERLKLKIPNLEDLARSSNNFPVIKNNKKHSNQLNKPLLVKRRYSCP